MKLYYFLFFLLFIYSTNSENCNIVKCYNFCSNEKSYFAFKFKAICNTTNNCCECYQNKFVLNTAIDLKKTHFFAQKCQ